MPSLDDFAALSEARIVYLLNVVGLTQLDALSNLVELEWFLVSNAPLLENLEGISNFQQVQAIAIEGCPLITDLGALGNCQIGEVANISRLPLIASLDGLNVDAEMGLIYIEDNAALVDIDALSGVTDISTALRIAGNHQLTSADAFASLADVNDLNVTNNDALVDIDAFLSLRSAFLVNISSNPSLPQCQVDDLEQHLTSNGETMFYAADNGPLCSSGEPLVDAGSRSQADR